MLSSISNRNLALALIASLLGAVAFSSGHFSNPDSHLRLSQAFSIVKGDGFAIKTGVGNIRHGNIAVAPNGLRYSVYGPGQIVLFTPFAWFATESWDGSKLHPHYIAEVFVSFIGPFVHFLTAFLLYFVARWLGRGRGEAGILAFIFAFGVMSLATARDGYEHTYEAFFLLASMYCAWLSLDSRKGNTHLLAAGFILGLGALFRPNILLAAPALFLIARSPIRVVMVAVGALPAIVCLLAYNHMRFGNVVETGYLQAWAVANPGVRHTFDVSAKHLSRSVTGLLFSPGKGLFVFSPVLLGLLFFGPASCVKRKAVIVPVAYIILSYLALYASNFAWHGSVWSWGPRYLVPVIPFLVLALPLQELSRFGRRSLKVLIAASLAVQFFSVVSNYKRHLIYLWRDRPDVFHSGDIITQPELSPLVGSVRSALHVFKELFSRDILYTYFDPNGWSSEARPASLDMMLASSIDLNSVDLWWVRLLYFPINDWLKALAAVLGLSAVFLIAVPLVRVAKRQWQLKCP